jgi:hypothetical protein
MGKLSVFGFLHEQWTELPISTADISDQSLIVVGTNVGLGNEAAVHLAQLKPKSLLITSRDEVKCELTKAGMHWNPPKVTIRGLHDLYRSGDSIWDDWYRILAS